MELKRILVFCILTVMSKCQRTTSKGSTFPNSQTITQVCDDVITQMQEKIQIESWKMDELKYKTNQEIIELKEIILALKGNNSNKGATGNKGDRGIPGPRGERGTPGLKGDKGSIGPKGNRGNAGLDGLPGIGGEKGESGRQGPKGDRGNQGLKGDKGIQGLNGDRGNQGLKGDRGSQGLKGDRGNQGLKGDRGNQGLNGDRGSHGLKGDRGNQGLKGDRGSQGLKGDKGSQGLNGDRGTQGMKGDRGSQGLKGDRGSQGLKGDRGSKGDTGVFYPSDCSDDKSFTGVKTIQPRGQISFKVYCSGGCVYMARRFNGSVNFNQGWFDYKEGFGPLEGEHFIGLDNLHGLLTQGNYKLRIDLTMWPPTNKTGYAEYSLFDIGDKRSNYRLTIGGYTGDAGDSLTYHNGMEFSTRDRDNDADPGGSCALTYKGAWWYKGCHFSNLFGIYNSGPECLYYASCVIWYNWPNITGLPNNNHYSFKKFDMKVCP